MKDNELIAEFMGLIRREPNAKYNLPQYYKPEKDKRKLGRFMGYPDQLKYSTSWDWLMPVVDKILLWEVQFLTQSAEAKKAKEVTDLKICCDRSDVYHEVIEFIKWYNENIKERE